MFACCTLICSGSGVAKGSIRVDSRFKWSVSLSLLRTCRIFELEEFLKGTSGVHILRNCPDESRLTLPELV